MLKFACLSQLHPGLDKEAKSQHLPYLSIFLQIETPSGSSFQMIHWAKKWAARIICI